MELTRWGARLALAALLAAASPTGAQTPATHPTGARPLTAEDLEPFLDGLMPLLLARDDIAGAVVAVVKDGRPLLAKGYGYADVASRAPVRGDATLFNVASVTKLFTATAVMQLVEQGRLDLDRDVREYLDFEIPRAFPGPVTLRRLLSHTGGFEDQVKTVPLRPGEALTLRRLVTAGVPAQIYPPGAVAAYSNWGLDLAGYVVERATGLPYEEYVRRHVLEPLGMTRSTFAASHPERPEPALSRAYRVASEPPRPRERWFGGSASAGLSSTGADIARFMIAHLQLGRSGDRRILREETARLMGATQFRTHPAVNGAALGFGERSRQGYRMLGHPGALGFHHSDLVLFPDEGVGLFLSYNSAGSGGAPRRALLDAFMARYLPPRAPSPPAVATAGASARAVAGTYVPSRRQLTSIGKLTELVEPVRVVARDDGTIEVSVLKGVNGRPARWREVAPLVWREERDAAQIAFVRDASGRVTRAAIGGGYELHRAGWRDSATLAHALLGVAVAVQLGNLLLWPVGALVRRHYAAPPADAAGRRLRRASRVVSLCFLAGLGATVALLARAMEEMAYLDGRLDPWIRVAQLVVLAGVVGTPLVVYGCVRAWRRGGGSGWARAHATALAAACLVLGWLAFDWNVFVLDLTY
jgi:CubicO group peptidase (beta-lactamase class C family)